MRWGIVLFFISPPLIPVFFRMIVSKNGAAQAGSMPPAASSSKIVKIKIVGIFRKNTSLRIAQDRVNGLHRTYRKSPVAAEESPVWSLGFPIGFSAFYGGGSL
jgi:hypothetical protein